ncbi:MAG: hypothetical protein M9915_01510 [Rhizobacter sp.]|nr:hypothetical protein [Rhizobacter sp.]
MKQILSIDVPTLRPRNPVAALARMRRAGPHGPNRGAQRQQAQRELQRSLQREVGGVHSHRPSPMKP